jgi:hypothetical protein
LRYPETRVDDVADEPAGIEQNTEWPAFVLRHLGVNELLLKSPSRGKGTPA